MPIDYNTAANWQRIRSANIDTIIGADAHPLYTKAVNETAIANSHAKHVRLLVFDASIFDHRTVDAPGYHYFESVLPAYASDSRVAGLVLRDEPPYGDFEGLANSYRRIKEFNRNWQITVNLALNAWPYATDEPKPLVVSSIYSAEWGRYLTPGNRLGQTLLVPKGISTIADIELCLDPIQWPPGEVLNLTLWDSPKKSVRFGQSKLAGSTTNYPRFVFEGGASVVPGRSVYFELTHAGGAHQAVGRLLRSVSNTYKAGTAYEDGSPVDYDFCFRVHALRKNVGDGYENIIDDWVNLSGADHILSTTVYPWRGYSDAPEYFSALERLRGRGLAHELPFGLCLQSMQINDARNGYLVYRDPTIESMRWNAYSALIYGAKKLAWFLYWPPAKVNGYFELFSGAPVSSDGSPTAKFAGFGALNRELSTLGAVMKDLTSRRVFHTGTSLPEGVRPLPGAFFVRPADTALPLIFGHLTNRSGRSFVMVMNRDYRNSLSNVTLRFDDAPASVTEIDKAKGREVRAPGYANGEFFLGSLNPAEGRLFALRGAEPYGNLAAVATVRASSSWETTALGCGIDKVHDDIRQSVMKELGWSSQGGLSSNHTEWILFDLGSVRAVAEVDLYPQQLGQMFPKRYQIDTSIDGRAWTAGDECASSGTSTKMAAHPIGQRLARYVRITGTELREVQGQYRMQLGEVEIYSAANLAASATVTASSSFEAAPLWGLDAVRDRQRVSAVPPYGSGLGWSSNCSTTASESEGITFDLGSKRNVSEVLIYPRNDLGNVGAGFPLDFSIETSTDGATFGAQVRKTNHPEPDYRVQRFRFSSVATRYVRILGTKLRRIQNEGGPCHRMQFAEVEIY